MTIRDEVIRNPEAHLFLIEFLANGDDDRIASGLEKWLAMPDVHRRGCGCRTHRHMDPPLPVDHREASDE